MATSPTLLHHLYELRRRLAYSVAVMAAGGILGYTIRGPIIAALQRPLGQKLFYTSPMGSFDFVVRICLLVGFLIALPVFCYNLLRFIEPALPKTLSWRFILTLILCSSGLTVSGVAFAYYLSLPAALHFFNSVGTNNLHPLISIDQYFNFVFGYFATFAIVFQLPLMLLFINNITPLGPGSLGKWRKWVVVGAFAIALVVPSAPDPLSQVILALPIILLYELSIWLVWAANRRRTVRPQAVVTVAETPDEPLALPAKPAVRVPAHAGVVDLRGFGSQPKPFVNVLDLRGRG